MKLKCLCGKEYEIILPDGHQIIDVHYALSTDGIRQGEGVVMVDGKPLCPNCQKKIIYVYDLGSQSGYPQYVHPVEKLIDQLARGYGMLRPYTAFFLGLVIITGIANLLMTILKRYLKIFAGPIDFGITDGIIGKAY